MKSTLLPMAAAGLIALTGCSGYTEGFGLGAREGVYRLAEWQCDAAGPLDLNGDGLVQADEWGRYSRLAYSAWDEDVNGRVTRAEFDDCWSQGRFPGAEPTPSDAAWAAFNPDGNDYLNSYEYWSQSVWSRLDTNRNGVADAGEWTW